MSEFDQLDALDERHDSPPPEEPDTSLPSYDSYEAAKLRLAALTPLPIGLKEYLDRCNQKGSKYSRLWSRYPNFTQLGRYCDCDPTTIARIASGETQNASMYTLGVISALAVIYPPLLIGDKFSQEQKARRHDADDWLEADPETRGTVLNAILSGILKRVDEKLLTTAQQTVAQG